MPGHATLMPAIPAPTRTRSDRRSKLAMILIVASFLLSGCATWTLAPLAEGSTETCLASLPERSAPVTGVFVEPDDGYEPVLEEIEAARCALDLTMYMLTDDILFDALIAADGRGVRVRVILDQHPFGMFGDQQEAFDRLRAGGIDVQWGADEFQFTHAKYMVVDERVALVMNPNFTGSAFNGNREFGVITTSPDAVDHAAAVFRADWSGDADGAPGDGPLLVSPVNARDRLMALIASAETSIDMYAEIIRDDVVLKALQDAVGRGVRVRLLMNASLDPEDIASVEALAASGVEVRLMETLYIHSKVMIVDGDRSLVGSINYSMTSLDRNREVAMMVDDELLVSRIASVYERDWMRAVPLASLSATSSLAHDRDVHQAYAIRAY